MPMMRITFLFLLTALSCSVMARLSTDKIPPMLLKHAAYWRGHLNSDFFKQNLLHPDLWKKSKIITSVKIQKKEYGLNVLQLKSIGVVNAPIIFVFKHLGYKIRTKNIIQQIKKRPALFSRASQSKNKTRKFP